MTKTIKTQKEFDEIEDNFEGTIEIKETTEWLRINRRFEKAEIVVSNNATISSVSGNATISYVLENATISSVSRNATIFYVLENATISSVSGNATIFSVSGNATIFYVSGNATISSVSGNAKIISMWMYSVCLFISGKASVNTYGQNIVSYFKEEKEIKLKLSKKTTRVILEKLDWFENNGIDKKDKKIILYKKVSKDFLTQENTKNETKWEIGNIVEHNNWCPEKSECGNGKFHACSKTFFCDEFRNIDGDKYIKIEVDKKDLYEWKDNPRYPHKIGFRKCKVLKEVNRYGEDI